MSSRFSRAPKAQPRCLPEVLGGCVLPTRTDRKLSVLPKKRSRQGWIHLLNHPSVSGKHTPRTVSGTCCGRTSSALNQLCTLGINLSAETCSSVFLNIQVLYIYWISLIYRGSKIFKERWGLVKHDAACREPCCPP